MERWREERCTHVVSLAAFDGVWCRHLRRRCTASSALGCAHPRDSSDSTTFFSGCTTPGQRHITFSAGLSHYVHDLRWKSARSWLEQAACSEGGRFSSFERDRGAVCRRGWAFVLGCPPQRFNPQLSPPLCREAYPNDCSAYRRHFLSESTTAPESWHCFPKSQIPLFTSACRSRALQTNRPTCSLLPSRPVDLLELTRTILPLITRPPPEQFRRLEHTED